MIPLPLQLVDGATVIPCGACTACCTVMAVPELQKEFHSPCPHVCAAGCRIYDARPRICREWFCLWARGALPGDERRRPDRLGLILDITLLPGAAVLTAYEVWPGASQHAPARDLLDQLQQTYKVCIVTPDRTVYCSDAEIAAELRLALRARRPRQQAADEIAF